MYVMGYIITAYFLRKDSNSFSNLVNLSYICVGMKSWCKIVYNCQDFLLNLSSEIPKTCR